MHRRETHRRRFRRARLIAGITLAAVVTAGVAGCGDEPRDGDPRGLSTWLEQEVHHGTPPVSLTIDVVPAPDSARHCGILILDSGTHHRVVAFARAP